MATFSERLKLLRVEKGLTIEELAEALGSAKSTISRYENGVREPKKDFLQMLASFFNVSMAYLLCETDVRKLEKNKKDEEKDLEEILEDTMKQLENQQGLMLSGEILDDNDLILIKNALRNGLEYAKSMKKLNKK